MNSNKFQNEKITLDGTPRASVKLESLKTLWFNTGSQCNLSCENCYIESNPRNDKLSYINVEDISPFLDEVKSSFLDVNLVGLTGGEPFLNPNIINICDKVLSSGIDVLVLTNAYKAMPRFKNKLIDLKNIYKDKLHIRVSLDHYTEQLHEKERGFGVFWPTIENIKWLYENNFNLSIAGRSLSNENLEDAKVKYRELLSSQNILIQNLDEKLVVFPEMDLNKDVPEITIKCWDILKKSPSDQMCASERMIVKRKAESSPVVLPCTLLAYDKQFELGHSLKESKDKSVFLNHPFCAQFCVLGSASCSSAK